MLRCSQRTCLPTPNTCRVRLLPPTRPCTHGHLQLPVLHCFLHPLIHLRKCLKYRWVFVKHTLLYGVSALGEKNTIFMCECTSCEYFSSVCVHVYDIQECSSALVQWGFWCVLFSYHCVLHSFFVCLRLMTVCVLLSFHVSGSLQVCFLWTAYPEMYAIHMHLEHTVATIIISPPTCSHISHSSGEETSLPVSSLSSFPLAWLLVCPPQFLEAVGVEWLLLVEFIIAASVCVTGFLLPLACFFLTAPFSTDPFTQKSKVATHSLLLVFPLWTHSH